MPLFLYHVSQTDNNDYDTYSDFVVAAPDEDTARRTIPGGYEYWSDGGVLMDRHGRRNSSSWVSRLDLVAVRLLGTADPSVEAGIICESFHAG